MKKDFLQWLRHYISPAFLILLFASLVLWYIAKLSYTYTTDLDIDVKVADSKFEVECVVEGVGTNLFGYRLYKGGKVTIPLSELSYTRSDVVGNGDEIIISPQSLQNAISVRYSDIKVISISAIPSITLSQERENQYLKR